MLEQRKQNLVQQIGAIKDENILIMLEEELSYHLQNKTNSTDELTPEQWSELITLANQTSDNDVVSHQEFLKLTSKWRTK